MKKQLTERQKAFLDALFDTAKGDVKKAMNIAGYSPTTPVSTILESLREEIIELSRNMLAMNAPRAALALAGVLSEPEAIGNKEKMRAAEQILDRVGVVKTEKIDVSTSDTGVLFILPSKRED
jgi:hypothetical protein